jgi:hypothetical protein
MARLGVWDTPSTTTLEYWRSAGVPLAGRWGSWSWVLIIGPGVAKNAPRAGRAV